MSVLDAGEDEALKLSIHAAAGLLVGICALYNALAWQKRREAHLAVNALFYSAVTAVEVKQVIHHCR